MSLMCSKTQGIVWSKPTAAGATVLKKTLAQVFSCEICEIFKNTFFYRTPPGDCFWLELVDTGRKPNVHKTLKRRLGRLLNVLCRLNLYPASFVRNFLELLKQICCKAPVSILTLTLNIFSIVNPFVFVYTLKVCASCKISQVTEAHPECS